MHSLIDAPAVLSEEGIAYLPLPNRVDVLISDQIAPSELNPTAFVFLFDEAGRLVLANNARRGLEIQGGHREGSESAMEAALREAFEETGCRVGELVPVGAFRSVCSGEKPDGYKYPFPISFQQFFVGSVIERTEYVENDECLKPVSVLPEDADKHLDPRTLVLLNEAKRIVDARRIGMPRR